MPNMSATEFWLAICIIFGVLFGGGLIICGLFVKERIKATTPKEKFNFKQFVKNYADPYKNRSYRWHIVMYVAAFICLDMISALAVYYATDVWHGQKLFDWDMSSLFIIAPLMVAAVIMFPLARYVMDKKTKQFAFRMGLPAYIIAGILLCVMDPSWAPPVLVPIVALLMGFGFGGAQMMPWIIFPDTVDVGQMATGERSTGTYSGMMTLARKIAGALGVGLIGWILDPLGYVSNDSATPTKYIPQSERCCSAIRLIMGLAMVVFIAIALWASFNYKVDQQETRARQILHRGEKGGHRALRRGGGGAHRSRARALRQGRPRRLCHRACGCGRRRDERGHPRGELRRTRQARSRLSRGELLPRTDERHAVPKRRRTMRNDGEGGL